MKTFKITFRHTEVREFEAYVEAETKEEAEEILEESPFDYVADDEGDLIEGKDFEIIKIQEEKSKK